MLVLRRKIGEVLVISGGIEIEVMGITRSRVKLGIRAPKEVVVQRGESLPVAGENAQAALLLAKPGGLREGVLRRFLQQYSQIHTPGADM